MKYFYENRIQSSITKSFIILVAFGLMTTIFIGCSSSTSSNDEDGGSNNEAKTFDIMLSADGLTKVGTAETEIITPDSDAYIDEGFFITLEISSSNFDAPYELNMSVSNGVCGTWDVAVGEKAEMPCDYNDFLNDPTSLQVISEDGSGVEAYTVGS